ncbi:hypothetical protein [Streptomyces sp. NPDC057363]|uniref:hypothetical protein n=1 Tax=Streptomyces sp. NPDC057363 TaxID=3346107 RepID=UPI0036361997
MISVTDEQVKETLRQVVSERPEYIYSSPDHMQGHTGDPSCFYVHRDNDEDRTPVSGGCVVGVVLQRLGVSLEELAKEEGNAALNSVPRLLSGLSSETVRMLDSIQSYQDQKTPWGMAYAQATGETI